MPDDAAPAPETTDETLHLITAEQHKLLSSAIRIRIIHALADTPRTAKQTAELLDETPGNVHYHMQRLCDGGLLKLVETRPVGGIVEKYYRAVATRFRMDRSREQGVRPHQQINTWLPLTVVEREELMKELTELLEAWERRTLVRRREGAVDFEIDIKLVQQVADATASERGDA